MYSVLDYLHYVSPDFAVLNQKRIKMRIKRGI